MLSCLSELYLYVPKMSFWDSAVPNHIQQVSLIILIICFFLFKKTHHYSRQQNCVNSYLQVLLWIYKYENVRCETTTLLFETMQMQKSLPNRFCLSEQVWNICKNIKNKSVQQMCSYGNMTCGGCWTSQELSISKVSDGVNQWVTRELHNWR